MGLVAAAAYAAIGAALIGSGAALWTRESMDDVPLYDAASATNPAALARVLGLSLVAFGVSTLVFAGFEVVDRTSVVVVSAYGVVVLSVGVVAATRTREYE